MKTIVFRGMRIHVENEAGSVRSGVDRVSGKPWSTKMPYAYGEIIGSHGVDGDPVDVFIGPDKSASFVYIVHQLNHHTGEFDEDKCFIGFDDAMDAKAAYYKAYDNPDLFYGSIETIPLVVFKKHLKMNDGDSMIRAQMDVKMGDPVTVDGLRGRGVIVAVDGDDVVIRYRDGMYIKRNKMFVHNMGDNMYKSKYVSATGTSEGVIKEWQTRKQGDWNPFLKVPSGTPRKAQPDAKNYAYGNIHYQHDKNLRERVDPRILDNPSPRHQELSVKQALSDAERRRDMAELGGIRNIIESYGTKGRSGRKPGFAKGLNKWKPMDKEIEQARKDPKQKKLKLKAAEVINSPELNVVSAPTGPGKTIKKVGTNFCVVSTGTDKNFGCYNSREQAQAVLQGKSFIEPNIPEGLQAMLSTPGAVIGHKKKVHTAKMDHRPNPSMHRGKGIGHQFTNPGMHNKTEGTFSTPLRTLESFGDLGEPMAGSMGHAHIEPELWFNPPSEKRPRRIPVDDPGEKDDRFLDVTKRKQAKKDRMERLKRSAPAGLPALIPARTTLVAPHTAVYMPAAISSSAIKIKANTDKRMRVSFDRLGCI